MPAPTDLTLGQKLDPRRFTDMSPKMAAIVAYILGDEATFLTQPAIIGLTITSDGFLLASRDDMTTSFIGGADDFQRNWDVLIVAAGLTDEEEKRVRNRLLIKVPDWRPDDISRMGAAMAQGGLI